MENIKYTINGILPPAFVTLSGQKYLMPGWIPIEDNITFDNINHVNPFKTKDKPKTFKVQGSGKNVYTVTLKGKTLSCDCPAGKFRGNCKHANQIKEKLKIS